MLAVPTSKTPQPQAQANAKPGTNALTKEKESNRTGRRTNEEAVSVAAPRDQLNRFMMSSTENPTE
jgi:hypothetical protein